MKCVHYASNEETGVADSTLLYRFRRSFRRNNGISAKHSTISLDSWTPWRVTLEYLQKLRRKKYRVLSGWRSKKSWIRWSPPHPDGTSCCR
jgi:hypothetical protein